VSPRTIDRPVLAAILLLALIGGCSKKAASDSTMAPESPAGDELAQLEQQLTQRESELQAIGVAPRTRRDVPGADGDAGGVGATSTADASAPTRSTGPAPGVAPSQPSAEKLQAPGDEAGGRCERVCEISAAICGLETQICGLLPRHRGEARYQDACDRAVADCQLATEACHACTAN